MPRSEVPPRCALALRLDRRLFVDEVAVAGAVQQRRRQLTRLIEIFGERQRVLDQVARMTATQRNVPGLMPPVHQVLDRLGVERNALLPAAVLEDGQKLSGRRPLRKNLVLDAAQERLVDQRAGLQVGREHDENIEWQLDLLSAGQRQEVDAALERNDPAVQQLSRRVLLPAEVVNPQDAAVGNGLYRCPIKPGGPM